MRIYVDLDVTMTWTSMEMEDGKKERERENTCSDKTIFYFNLCVSMALFSFLPSASMSKEKKI
jgi:hypothetical protein